MEPLLVQPLVVLIVFFGELPPWLPLTLHSMASNKRVSFVVVGDAAKPQVLPPNVHFEQISFPAMQQRLTALTGSPVRYTSTYKANDIKPLLPHLYPSLVAGHEWWAWADLDVVFGDLLSHFDRAMRHPACCAGLEIPCPKKARRDPHSPCFNSTRPMQAADTYWNPKQVCVCTRGETVNALSPLYPNPWRKKCWGPFTAFNVRQLGTDVYRGTPRWREIIAEPSYVHSDEWWGPFAGKGFETMGEIMTRLSDEGKLVMSKRMLPFSEAKSCADIECTFCPCGAMRLRFEAGKLLVNDEESMVLHLAESKPRWFQYNASVAAALPPYSREVTNPCFEVDGLGALAADDGLAHAGELPRVATRYSRHRPISPKAASCIEYGRTHPAPLAVRACEDRPPRVNEAVTSSLGAREAAVRAHAALVERYNHFSAQERNRTLAWLCAWSRLSALYFDSLLPAVDLSNPRSRRLPGAHGNRRVRTPLYGGERLGWWRRTVNMSNGAHGGPCAPDQPLCPFYKHAYSSISKGGRRARKMRSGEGEGLSIGRRLRGAARYDMNTPAVPGIPCLAPVNAKASLEQVQRSIFESYLHLQHVAQAEAGRLQRWRCSWLYLLRACLESERQLATSHNISRSRCHEIAPPKHEGRLGWNEEYPTRFSDLNRLLFAFRCW
ncbi:hypothetical protein AB1Y20_018958 [Prymnesium parvum]|uniref:Protein xylosyltransferase n=1 Tax=Prymnesium parvum TaxID=97485 RepID=A0AB34JQZ6_PRYPA